MMSIGRLHVLTDEVLQRRFSHLEITRLAADGGADVVQLREKRPRTTREQVDLARKAREILPDGVQLIVNDRADVALAAAADGVHLGRDDLSYEVARHILGPRRIVGGTANSVEEARQRFVESLDYLGVGPVFGTASKQNPAPPLGLDALARIARESPVPIIAIGNITPERVPEVLAAGAHGIAVLSGVTCAVDPARAAALYREAIERFAAAERMR
jgi:thiamine-phosphate diphosphorylase